MVSGFDIRNWDFFLCGLGVLARKTLLGRSVEHFIGKNLWTWSVFWFQPLAFSCTGVNRMSHPNPSHEFANSDNSS